ncbi:energy transducer TonB [Brevundimonas sp.]
MSTGPFSFRPDRLRLPGIVVAVAGLHLGLLVLSGLGSPEPVLRDTETAIEVLLVRPPVPPEPVVPEPTPPSPQAGGGAQAAPSRIHVTPRPRPVPPELPAPPVQAPEPELVVGIAPTATPQPGQGLGGQGAGQGTGVGSGTGQGTGSTRERFLRGPTVAERLRHYPPGASARRGASARIRCRISIDERLEACRVVDERPAGQGFGQAALAVATYFRVAPPTEDGRPIEGREFTVGIDFPPR